MNQAMDPYITNLARAAHANLKKRGEIRKPLLTREDEARASEHLIEKCRELLLTKRVFSVAKELGISRSTIAGWKKAGLVTYPDENKLKKQAMQDAIKLFDGGMAIRPAAEKCGVCYDTLRRKLMDLGRNVTLRAQNRTDPAKVARGLQLHRGGMCLSAAAKEAGVSASTLREELRIKP